jgi:hypothetical protein
MAEAVTFWRFPEEEPEFVRFLESLGPVVALPKGKVTNKSQLQLRSLEELLADGVDSLLLALPGMLGELPIRQYQDDTGQSWAVLFTDIPVLTYRRGVWRGPQQLGGTHISGSWTILSDDQSRILDQPAAYIRWGKKVLAWVRKQTPQTYNHYRVTSKVAEAIQSGLQIVP